MGESSNPFPLLNHVQVLGLFLCYPLGGIMSAVPVGAPKHLFSFLLGAFLLQFVLGVQWIHQLISTMMCYVCFQVSEGWGWGGAMA